ncbi:MAG: hypothetical protein ACKVX7_15545 [Planctomycetota bacterium]
MLTQWLFRGVGISLVLVGVFFDSLVTGSAPGFGTGQLLLIGLGVGVALLGVVRGRARRLYVRIACVAVSMYIALLFLEVLALWVLAPPRATKNPLWSLRGFVQPANWGGYELTPGYRGRHEDGLLSVPIEINAIGDRDSLPAEHAAAERRVLLLGDSFAFGWGLRAEDTIDRQLEQMSSGNIASYNLGVPGYGPEDTLEHYRERSAWSPTHTFYLLFNNDLRHDNCRKAIHAAFEGLIVLRNRPDGTPFSDDEQREKLAEAQRDPRASWPKVLKQVLVLHGLRERVGAFSHLDRVLVSGRPEQFDESCVRAAVQHAAAMQELAQARGQQFAVVVIPTRAECAMKRYSTPLALGVAELKQRAIQVVEVRDLLGSDDYFAHDEHLSAGGAAGVAKAILESMR